MNLLKALPIILIVFVSGCTTQVNQQETQNEQASGSSPQQLEETSPQQPVGEGILRGEVTSPPLPTTKEYTVEIISTGFVPNTLTIKVNDRVIFINKDTVPHWPASAVHPTHCEYKGCGVFDARKGLAPNEPYSMVFDLAGNWKYHDHLDPGMTGTIVVQ